MRPEVEPDLGRLYLPQETTLSIHGLDMDARVVRANVFVDMLRSLLGALKIADKLANGREAHEYLLPRLRDGSAVATLRERPRRRQPSQSSISYFATVTTAVYNGEIRGRPSIDPEIVGRVEKLSRGANDQFDHAEIRFPDDNVIRIDDYLHRQAEDALAALTSESIEKPKSYKGIAFGTFGGVLKEIDSRGTVLRGKLVLTPSTAEIDCVMNKDRVPEARDSFDKRVVIKGSARYDGRGGLPTRVDVNEIRVIKQMGNIARWKGAFIFPKTDDLEDY